MIALSATALLMISILPGNIARLTPCEFGCDEEPTMSINCRYLDSVWGERGYALLELSTFCAGMTVPGAASELPGGR